MNMFRLRRNTKAKTSVPGAILATLFLLGLLFPAAGANAQQRITGQVLDEQNQPLAGVSVQVKGTALVTVTNVKGEFSIDVPQPANKILDFNFIGYKSAAVALGSKTTVSVQLQPSELVLEEVMVEAGYGRVRKSDVTGSLTSVKVDELSATRAASFDQLLAGKAAGINVITGNAAPGGAVNIRVRGTTSLRNNNDPLYVVDGSIIQTGDVANPMTMGTGGGNASQEGQNPLSLINPQDIESMEILKDASATAIYGAQGANGVVLITTKKGTQGRTRIQFNSTFTVSTLRRKLPLLGLQEYTDYRNALYLANGNTTDHMSSDGLVEMDWQDEMMNPAFSQVYRLSVSGNSANTSYYIAGGFSDRNGLIDKTSIGQKDLRLNFDHNINKSIKISSRTVLAIQDNSMTVGTEKLGNIGMTRQIVSRPPIDGNYDASGNFDADEQIEGPRSWLAGYDDETREYRANTALTVDAKILKWLTFRAMGSVDFRNSKRMRWYGLEVARGKETNGAAGYGTMTTLRDNVAALLLFDHKCGAHKISGTAGIEYSDSYREDVSTVGENFPNTNLRARGISTAQTYYKLGYTETPFRLFSALARAIYSYADKYVLTATFRADGSSKFDDGHRYGYYPSFAAAWRIKQESFMKNVTPVSDLKLRLGWGTVGNQSVPPFQTLSIYGSTSYANPNESTSTGFIPSNFPNPNLQWETTEQYNVGLDLGLLANRLNITFDAYLKQTKNDLLQEFKTPGSSGFTTMWMNRGTIRSKGLEFMVDASPVSKKDIRWNVNANITFNRSKLISLGMPYGDIGALKNVSGYVGSNLSSSNLLAQPANIFLDGYAVGLYFGYKTAGIMTQEMYDAQDPAKRMKLGTTNEIKPGDVYYIDQNGDYAATDADRTIIGDPNPKFTFGFGTTFTYKNLSLDVAFNGSYGNDILNASRSRMEDVGAATNILQHAYRQAWTADNQNTYYPRIGYTNNGLITDRLIEDGSYLRLQTLALSYRIPLKNKKVINAINVNFSANNLFVITNYTGFDPEVDSFTNDPMRIGVDLNSYPSARHFVFGLSLTF